MTASIRAGATRADILAVLMQGAGQAPILRLAANDGFAQVEKGMSYVLESAGMAVAIGGLFPASSPPRVIELAGGRTTYAIWFVAAPAAAKHLRAVKRACEVVLGDLALLGSFIVAEIDPDLKSAPKLARLAGLVPLERVGGHDLWTFPANAEPAHG